MTRAMNPRPGAGGVKDADEGPLLSGDYLERAKLPLTSLLFLLPLIAVYEVGCRFLATDIYAFTLLQRFLRFCHATHRFLPALIVVGMLLASHIARKDPWKLDFRAAALMGIESLALALPLLALNALAVRLVPLRNIAGHGAGNTPALLILSLGAGIYEELVFRLIGFLLLTLLLIDCLKIPKTAATCTMILLSSVLFAQYHYLGAEQFHPRSFCFRTAAGIYFGLLFFYRGFGVTAGCHAAYDVISVVFTAVAAR